jgi:hypothetical protein
MNRETEIYIEHVEAYVKEALEALKTARTNQERELVNLGDALIALENAVTVLRRAYPDR